MSKFRSFLLASAAAFSLAACNKNNNNTSPTDNNTTLGNWVWSATFAGSGRYYASSFVIGNYGYVVGGSSFSTSGTPASAALTDMWRFDPSANAGKGTWFGGIGQLASMPSGTGRNSGVGFAISGKGYVGTGTSVPNVAYAGGTQLNDMWQYDPATNMWKQMASVPGGPRFQAVGFSIGNLGYVGTGKVLDPNNPGTGNTINSLDFYSFDPTQTDTGKWVEEPGLLKDKRFAAQSFVNAGKGYVVGGINESNSASADFEVFTPGATQGTGAWRQLTAITPISDSSKTSSYTSDLARCNGVVLVSGGYAYLCTGSTTFQGTVTSTTWMYNFQTDQWVQRTPFETNNNNIYTNKPARFGAVGFSIGDRVFLGLGTGNTSGNALSDFTEFQPTAQYNAND